MGTLFEQLQSMLAGSVAPSHLNVGEAYVVHQNLTAYYYLRSKCALFAHHSQAPDLKAWWHDAREKVEKRIPQLEAQLDKYGVPRPQSFPVTTELTDEFLAI
ncbi:MAG TPA: hypothetical protein VNT26_17905, partial [Candidatus Sulfotelmatobacter sp.]|nr:hypothetical protein [Candidatus Sulfotelmatobacter sp.]